MDQVSLKGKRILVTGGTTGIGRATVALLAEQGGRVLTFGRHDPELQDSLQNARSRATGDVRGLVADVSMVEGVKTVFEAVDRDLGGLDILINNAGLSVEGVRDSEDAEWRYAVETNFVGYLACARESIKRLEASGGGHLVFIGSISAAKKSPGTSTYAATKAGIAAFAETLRKEVAEKNIKVTWIEPGSVGADMQESSPEEQRKKIAAHEMLYAEDIADAIAFALTRPARTDVSLMRVEPRLQDAN